MSGRVRAAQSFLPKFERPRTVIGLGVPVAPSFLDLEQEETVSYDGAALPDLLAESRRSNLPHEEAPQPKPAPQIAVSETPSEIRPRDASFHTSPQFPDDSHPELDPTVESNLHQLEAGTFTDSLAPGDPRAQVVHLHIGDSGFPDSVPPALVRPRPSRRRSLFAKVLFLTIVVGVVSLLAIELSTTNAKMRWLDPRPLATKGIKFVKEKIPWDRLPKLSPP